MILRSITIHLVASHSSGISALSCTSVCLCMLYTCASTDKRIPCATVPQSSLFDPLCLSSTGAPLFFQQYTEKRRKIKKEERDRERGARGDLKVASLPSGVPRHLAPRPSANQFRTIGW